jgi:hypothetical protein
MCGYHKLIWNVDTARPLAQSCRPQHVSASGLSLANIDALFLRIYLFAAPGRAYLTLRLVLDHTIPIRD